VEDKLFADDLTRLIREYQNRETSDKQDEDYVITREGRIGDLWYNPEISTLYVCCGRINGTSVWKEVNSDELK